MFRLKKVKKTVKKWNEFSLMAKKFLPFVAKQKKKLTLSFLSTLSYIAVGMLEPWPMKLIFDSVFLGNPLPKVFSWLPEERSYLLYSLIGSIVGIAVVRGVFYYYQKLLSSKAGQIVASKIRVELFHHVQKLSFSFHDRRKTGDLLARLTSDIRILRDILITLPQTILSEFFLMIAMVTVMSFMDLQLTSLTLLVIPMLVLLLKKYQKPMKSAIMKQREKEGHLTSIASEVLGAIKVVQGFGQEMQEVNRFGGKNKATLKSGLKASKLEAKLKWASDISVACVTAIVLAVAAKGVIQGTLSPGDVLVFAFYLRRFNRPLRRVSRMTERMARGTASGERVWNLLNITPEIQDLPGSKKAPPLKGDISYQHVNFGYSNGKQILNDISLEVSAGERVAIVGPTGSGKSTLANLLPRFYEPISGEVLIDGINIQQMTLNSLREQITLVFQEPVLFATTIAENIAYGKPDATMEEIQTAAKKACIHPIIEALPEGYDTVLGERGGTLSGGQRQCVAIARAIVKDAPIVIMDEPTSGLDMKNALLVMNALKELMKGRTVIVISHQLETIQDVDRIIKIHKGTISNESVKREPALSWV